jgi:hypothetical protein
MAMVYDAGALLAVERGDTRMVRLHERAIDRGDEPPLVPVVVLAQAWRGGPQPRLSRLLQDCEVVEDTEEIGLAAGTVCAAAGSADVVDGIVVVTALERAARVVTSDPHDLKRIASAAGRRLELVVL